MGLSPTVSRDPDVADRRRGDGDEFGFVKAPTFTGGADYAARFAVAIYDTEPRPVYITFGPGWIDRSKQ